LTAVDAVTRAVPGLRAKIAAVSADDYQQLVDTGRGPQARGVASSAAADPQPPLTYVDDDDSRTGPARAAAAGVQSVSPVVALLDDVIGAGLAMGASDIHIEHERKAIQVRYRVDGMLRPRKEPISLDMGKPLVSRVKLLAKLDITDTRKPQDGRISARFGSRLVDLRVSTLRAKLGEKIVMRVLDAEASVTDLKSLIVVEKVRQAFLQMIHRPNGLVMVTGPTGSGKSTTLYGALQARRRPELNIVTVEDPIEYHLDGVTQVQVQPEAGTTFALILRALLRQDPNVILVGEVRDTETARMAIEASMTGHMVLTSVHTNGALEAIARLDDLGVDRHGIANGLVGVVHQRLVRKCCPQCLEPFEYPSLIVDMLYKHGAFLPNERPTLQRGKGCGACAGTGFKGRVGIYEILVANEAVRDAIARGADQVALRQAAAGGAMVELARYAGILVGTGLTIPGEILNLIQRVGGA
jgi:type II secretory ATPase GspE/PulE/Tfp pilus assembly ATPase PilB-like protein